MNHFEQTIRSEGLMLSGAFSHQLAVQAFVKHACDMYLSTAEYDAGMKPWTLKDFARLWIGMDHDDWVALTYVAFGDPDQFRYLAYNLGLTWQYFSLSSEHRNIAIALVNALKLCQDSVMDIIAERNRFFAWLEKADNK